MPDNRRGQRNGAVSNSSVHNIEESLRRLNIQTNGKEDSTAYPDRPGEPDCLYYLRTGLCGYGNNCRFNHPTHLGQVNQNAGELPERDGEPDCVYFLKTGTCKFGSTCKYNHPRDRRGAGPIVLNVVGLPMRQDEKPCPHYLRTGSCKFGVACKFHHPQPALNGSNVVPVSGPFPYGPPSGPWPLQTPPTYLPVLLPPSQAWSTYVGSQSLSPISANGVFGGAGLTPASQVLPERPCVPECRYFINTGNCKYGADCKYHHPKPKMPQIPTTPVSPLGLPLRPGQAVCSYYSLYGICKFGPTCIYDHPPVGMGYSYNYTISMPSLSIANPSFLHYGPMLHSSESTPSKSPRNPVFTGAKTPERLVSPSRSLSSLSEQSPDQSE